MTLNTHQKTDSDVAADDGGVQVVRRRLHACPDHDATME